MEEGYSMCLNKWALDKEIKDELGLLLIISSLCAEKGYCFASNQYLAQLFDISEVSVSRKIKKLEEKNYITIEYTKRGCEIVDRHIRLTNLITDDYQKCKSTINKNVKENNISINNTSINKVVEEYENEIGLLTPYAYQRLESYFEDLPEEVIIEAIHIASANNKKTLSYIEAILKRCISENIKTKADMDLRRKTKQESKKDSYLEQNDIESFDYLYEN